MTETTGLSAQFGGVLTLDRMSIPFPNGTMQAGWSEWLRPDVLLSTHLLRN
ncbi:hypothetical protein [Candidatus Poriferisodalis sp.]|uniref:hypothetical protein n=1 Tax=Candidatus Poriferisodalis sp. TaxID=3101277 RepID=UPI003B51BD03